MSKHEFPPFNMIIEGGRLVPASAYDQERLDSFRRGTKVRVRFTEEKDRVLVRKWWAILGLVVKQCKVPWKTKDEASEAIKLALGIVNLTKTVNGDFLAYPKSLTDLEDPELQEAVDQMTELLSRITGVDVETLKKETAHVAEEDHDPETGELLPSDTGDGSSPSAGTDDATATASSHEPHQPSSSLADGSTAEPAGTTPPSQPAGSPSLIPASELPVLRAFAKDVINTADANPSTEAMKRVVNRWVEGRLKDVTSEAGGLAITAIRKSVAAIMRNDGSVDVMAVLEHHAEGLGCTPADLGG